MDLVEPVRGDVKVLPVMLVLALLLHMLMSNIGLSGVLGVREAGLSVGLEEGIGLFWEEQ